VLCMQEVSTFDWLEEGDSVSVEFLRRTSMQENCMSVDVLGIILIAVS
jgi:hypothetical protein